MRFIRSRLTNVAPYKSSEHLQGLHAKATDAAEWLENTIGTDLRGRIPKSIKIMSTYDEVRGGYGSDMFYFLQTVSELEDIIEFSNRLRCHGSKRFIDAMKLAIKGPLFRAGAEGVPAHKSRNYLFELIVAARFVESGQLVDLSKPTDVVVVDLNLAVECKRVSSDSKVEKRVKAAIEQIERSGEKYREGAIFVDITSIFESSHSVNIVDETDILNAFSPPSDSEQLTTLFGSKVWHDVGQPIDAMKAKIGGLLTDKVPYVVFCYNYVGFHRSLFHERAVTGTCSYPLVKANFLNGLAWFAISKTLGVSLDLEV